MCVVERKRHLRARKISGMRSLAGCNDAASLNCAIQELCTESGVVARIDICTLAKAGKRQALCFLRIDPGSAEARLMGTPGLVRFGNDLLLVVDLLAVA